MFSKKELKDKIRGGWAGQTIGVTFGGPTEFRFKGTMIQDYQKIVWHDHYIKETFELDPGLYDDVYLDLTFVNILEKVGLNAPVDAFALEFANEDYKLWHANQAARYNILNGIMPPASGHWMNNPHADDIDFQIEADFAGMMAPGMTNTASKFCDDIGHIMNYGDGWYGGVFVSAMYTVAYISDDIDYVISQALSTIPKESLFYKTIADVIEWHKKHPDDWKETWFEIEKKHSSDKGCPEGVYNSFNIDARLNAAYVVVGLLYGEKDFFKTMDISTRCGQDSDCNPATAAGILGVMFGYDGIPDYWKPALEEVEGLKFPYMEISLNEVYDLTYKHSLQLIEENGGEVNGDKIKIKIQKPETVRFEESFVGLFPSEERYLRQHYTDKNINIGFKGNGIVVLGNVNSICSVPTSDYVALLDVYIDGEKVEQVKMPYDYIVRKYDVFHKYLLDNKDHHVEIKWVNKNPDFSIYMKSIVIYADSPSI
ncbi:ADP-ribosylglycohydrolase family protein [Gelidibacter salicanalis]|uniref:ADP-ribosylglycohydrolase family protein n=1 Tax=Gelidibacter salicanalis TaxID=291193 RepID=A0A934KYZ2_9FLAO|nr:ADP-ribosylglycohydrolase family protein [Gelidibacter salicanalis]MBJ7881950.1 ADP-ribosylglycohydrolase family protein [Gelidibacter salicanalis]